jgi:1,2-dihydroxy-3-keto-5-methylthiopentene dioxygenase
VDTNDYIKALRLFMDEPKWTPVNRDASAEGSEVYAGYRKSIGVGE